jgi:soluble lytic murein transglycosylase
MLLRHFIAAALLALPLSLAAAVADSSAQIDSSVQERQLFRQTRALLEKNQLTRARPHVATLKHYPLAPYLELPLLTARLDELPFEAVDTFLQRYPDSVPGDALRAAWLAQLAERGRWDDYLRYYDAATAGKAQQCGHIEALHQTGRSTEALAATESIWLSPIDLPTACDDALDRWLAAEPDRLAERVWSRLALALSQDQESLARHLVARLPDTERGMAETLLQVYRQPQIMTGLMPALGAQPHASAVLGTGLRRLARIDMDTAATLWKTWTDAGVLNAGDSFAARNAIARQLIGARGEAALPWLLDSDPHGHDSYMLEWRVRLALPAQNWSAIADWIAAMPAELAETPRWRYWHARALSASENAEDIARAQALFETLASDRSFYGFMAADHSDRPYQLNHQPLHPDVTAAQVAHRADLRRAREFYVLGEKTPARREWARALKTMSPAEQQASALLAKEWGWHDQALRLASISGGFDDLDLRFPIAYRDLMTKAARARGLPAQWLFAVARQESAFMADARSPVGAMGLLQLMPATARQVARQIGAPFDPKRLVEPARNIPLGSEYLGNMLARYNGNRILATAAYNAGPGRVSRLLAQQQKPLDMDIWIETFPIRETREYVQSVLAFAVIYGERLGEKSVALVGGHERVIGRPVEVSRAETTTASPSARAAN